MNDQDFYAHIYRLAFITRYSNRIRIHDEDVAQHSFFVSAIILQLFEKYVFDLEVALTASISHDIMESDVSDVTHDIKNSHPKLTQELRNAEAIEIKKYPKLIQYGYAIFENKNTPEGLIANLADVIQVKQYADMEISLGNSTFKDIIIISNKRICRLKEELVPYERKNKIIID